MSGTRGRPFLTARWTHLAMLNYRIEPAVLAPYVPSGTVLDAYEGTTCISLVAFLFEDTRLLGVPIPLHRTFEEMNLRFYVRRDNRRAVVFVRELVPRRAIAHVARMVYNEPYLAVPMQHRIAHSDDRVEVDYRWRFQKRWNSLHLRASGEPALLDPESVESFITEHYWGYTRQRNGDTFEYEVVHPPWRVWTNPTWSLDADVAGLYGEVLGRVMSEQPVSVLLAEGSPVAVYPGQRLRGVTA